MNTNIKLNVSMMILGVIMVIGFAMTGYYQSMNCALIGAIVTVFGGVRTLTN